jgi:HEPN domain-containing protein
VVFINGLTRVQIQTDGLSIKESNYYQITELMKEILTDLKAAVLEVDCWFLKCASILEGHLIQSTYFEYTSFSLGKKTLEKK